MLTCAKNPPTQDSPAAAISSLKNSSKRVWLDDVIVPSIGIFLSNAMSTNRSAFKESPSLALTYWPGHKNLVCSK